MPATTTRHAKAGNDPRRHNPAPRMRWAWPLIVMLLGARIAMSLQHEHQTANPATHHVGSHR